MKSCSEIRENISAYIDDELTNEERLSFEEHIAACAGCSSEFDDILHIAGLCRDSQEVELPENFKAELHCKLLKAAGEDEVKSPAFERARRIRLFLSIAAGFILIFLFTGIYRFGFSPRLESSTAAPDAAPAKLSQSAQFGAAEDKGTPAREETTAAAENQASLAIGSADAKLTEQPSVSSDTEIDRSTSGSNRLVQGPATLAKSIETANSSKAALTVSVDSPAADAPDIRSIAEQNGGGEQQPAAALSKAMGAMATVDDSKEIVIVLAVPNKQYDAFLQSLKSVYGQSNVDGGAPVTEDKTPVLESLIKKSDELGTEIKKLEDADQKADADRINELQAELKSVQDEIESLRLDTDFTFVTVTLRKK